MSAHVPVTAEELAEIDMLHRDHVREGRPIPPSRGAHQTALRSIGLARRLAHDLAERTAERDALAATVERLIREAGAIRLDERQRAKAEHDSLADQGRLRCERRCEELEDTIARMRRIINDADRVKDENETLRRDLANTRAELQKLHDVLSGAKKVST